MTPLFRKTSSLPDVFSMDEQFLAWTVAAHSPLETICTWEFQSVKGLTMIGYDPRLARIYHGNAIDSSVVDNAFFKASIPIHVRYAKFLLKGMMVTIESQSKMELKKKNE